MTDTGGWWPDPFGTHGERYYSGGLPTRLVRDGVVESYDDAEDDDFAGAALLAPGPSAIPEAGEVTDAGAASPTATEFANEFATDSGRWWWSGPIGAAIAIACVIAAVVVTSFVVSNDHLTATRQSERTVSPEHHATHPAPASSSSSSGSSSAPSSSSGNGTSGSVGNGNYSPGTSSNGGGGSPTGGGSSGVPALLDLSTPSGGPAQSTPEFPLAIILPLTGAVALASGFFMVRRRRHREAAS